MHVFLQTYMKKTPSNKKCLGFESLILNRTPSAFSSKVRKYNQCLTVFHPKINQELTFNRYIISSWKLWVSGSYQAKKIPKFHFAFGLLYDRNAAQTAFLTKYSECDLSCITLNWCLS